MINLIGIGYDIGDLTVNAFSAIIEADIIINFDNIDISDLDSYTKDKEIIDRDSIKSEEDLDTLSEDMIQLEEDSEEISNDSKAVYSKLNESYSLIELAISKSFDNDVALICSNNPNIYGIANLLIQISSKYSDVELKIHPGVSPIDYASSILGAPFDDFIAIDLNKTLSSSKELKNKIKFAIRNDVVLFIHNIIGEEDDLMDNFNLLKELVNEYGKDLLVAAVNDSSYEISKFNEIDEKKLNRNTSLVIGTKLSYKLEDYMVTSCDYIVEPKFISQNMDFFERYLKDETPQELDYDCDYLPCHKSLEACDFCYCPFYPCADGVTGGEWIKDKDVWSCQYCDWIHLEEPCQTIRQGLGDILKDVDDLKDKHIELLRLRRECLLKTLK